MARTAQRLSFVGVLIVAVAASLGAQEAHVGNLKGHADAGKKQYKRFCIGCHGERGDGVGDNAPFLEPKPRDFTAATFKCRSTLTGNLPTDEDLYKSVVRGFNTSAMPSWAPLTAQTKIDLVAYIKSFSPRWHDEKSAEVLKIPAETPVTIESISHGGELFQKLECWKCHGQEGRGDGPSASTLTDSKDQPIRPYNFTGGGRFKCGAENEDLYRIFMTGVDGTPMPSFNDVIKPVDAWDLVHYLRTLQKTRQSKENEVLKAAGGKLLPPKPEEKKPEEPVKEPENKGAGNGRK